MSGVRNKNDQYNYGAGGAAVGLYTSLNGIKARKVHTVVTKVFIYSMAGTSVNGGMLWCMMTFRLTNS